MKKKIDVYRPLFVFKESFKEVKKTAEWARLYQSDVIGIIKDFQIYTNHTSMAIVKFILTINWYTYNLTIN